MQPELLRSLISITARFFWKQGGTLLSVCVMERAPIRSTWDGIDEEDFVVTHSWFRHDCIPAMLAAGSTAQAVTALDIARRHNVDKINFDAILEFAPVGYPSSGGVGWAARRGLRRVDWPDSDREELSKISSFEFRLSKVTIAMIMRREDREFYPPVSTNAMLLMLEGFAWE